VLWKLCGVFRTYGALQFYRLCTQRFPRWAKLCRASGAGLAAQMWRCRAFWLAQNPAKPKLKKGRELASTKGEQRKRARSESFRPFFL
jgi:hypothetical protein